MVSADKSQSIIFLIRTFTYKRKKGRTFRRGQQLQWGPNEMHHKGTEWDLGSGTQLYLSHLPLAGLHGIFHSMDGCQSSWVGKFSQDMRMCMYKSHWAKFCQYPQTFESQCSDPLLFTYVYFWTDPNQGMGAGYDLLDKSDFKSDKGNNRWYSITMSYEDLN